MSRFLARLRQDRTSLVLFLIALCTLLACTLRTVALFTSFDVQLGYFRANEPLVIIASTLILLCALLCLAIPFLIYIEGRSAENAPLPTARFISIAACTVMLCVTAFYLLLNSEKVPAPTLLVLLTALSLLGSAVYHLLRLLGKSAHSTVAVGFSTILAATMMLATTYFDRYTQMNAPHKLSQHLCMLLIMFAMLYELRALLSRPAHRACAFVTVLAGSFGTVFALSNAIAFIGGVYSDVTYFLFDLTVLGFAACFITKSIRLIPTPDNQKPEVEQ